MKKHIFAISLLFISISAFAVDKNMAQTNHFALKAGQDWTWQKVAQTPKVKWEQKIPKTTATPTLYEVYGRINKYTNLATYGTKTQPKIVLITSSQLYKESENGGDTYKLADLFNKSELIPVKSNCSKKEGQVNSGEYQYFYKWQKPGFQPLYVYEAKFVAGTFAGGIIKEFAIAKDFNDFKILADSSTGSILDRYIDNESEVECKLV